MSSEIKRHLFNWKVKNLNLTCRLRNECLISPIFKAESLYGSSWCIKFYPRGKKESEDGWMACYLCRCGSDSPPEIECNFKIGISDKEGNCVFFGNSTYKFGKGKSKGWSNVLTGPMLSSNNHYSEDFIIVKCELTVNVRKYPLLSQNSAVTKVDFDEYSLKRVVNNLNSDCSEILQVNNASDVMLFEFLVQVLGDDIKIIVRRHNKFLELMSLSCQITLLDVAGTKQYSKHSIHFFEVNERKWEFPNFLKKSKLNSEKEKYLTNDCFTLQFEVKLSFQTDSLSIYYKDTNSFVSEVLPNAEECDTLNTLSDDMRRLYVDKIHADVRLHVADKTIPAHRNILSLRSPVFLAMFDSEMRENETGSVYIPDIDIETVNFLLEFIYTGKLENLDRETALKLLMAADKYQVLALREKCAKFLKSALSNKYVCDVLVVADLVQHAVLEGACIKYIKDNSECIFFSDEWKLVIKNNLQLAMKTVAEVSKLMASDQKKNYGQ